LWAKKQLRPAIFSKALSILFPPTVFFPNLFWLWPCDRGDTLPALSLTSRDLTHLCSLSRKATTSMKLNLGFLASTSLHYCSIWDLSSCPVAQALQCCCPGDAWLTE
jgi:hypothetical protein